MRRSQADAGAGGDGAARVPAEVIARHHASEVGAQLPVQGRRVCGAKIAHSSRRLQRCVRAPGGRRVTGRRITLHSPSGFALAREGSGHLWAASGDSRASVRAPAHAARFGRPGQELSGLKSAAAATPR
jgi:hypothetical protein